MIAHCWIYSERKMLHALERHSRRLFALWIEEARELLSPPQKHFHKIPGFDIYILEKERGSEASERS